MDSTAEGDVGNADDEVDTTAGTATIERDTLIARVGHALLRWLPVVILATTGVAATRVVVDLAPARLLPATSPGEAVATPMLSVRRLPSAIFVDAVVAARDDLLRDRLAAFVAGQPPDSCLVVDDDRGLLFDHRGDDPQVPASAQKIVTASAALLALGPDHRFVTTATAAGPVDNGTVLGDLYLVGGGDPLLATADYAERRDAETPLFTDIGQLADQLVAAGVMRIEGGVVGDAGRYDAVRYHPAWPPRFITQNQTGPLSALMVNDGFEAYSDGPASGFRPAADPTVHAAAVLATALTDRGVVVVGPPASGASPPTGVTLASVASAPLVEVVGQSLRESDNGTAELLLKELARRDGTTGTFEGGALVATLTLAAAGFDVDDVVIVDGSGLASGDTLTCSLLVELLDHDPVEASLSAGMAVSGESGTLRTRWLDTDLVGRIRAKTGTLNQVTALAGYAEGDDGVVRRFALLVNLSEPDVIQRSTVDSQRDLAEALVQVDPLPDPAIFGITRSG